MNSSISVTQEFDWEGQVDCVREQGRARKGHLQDDDDDEIFLGLLRALRDQCRSRAHDRRHHVEQDSQHTQRGQNAAEREGATPSAVPHHHYHCAQRGHQADAVYHPRAPNPPAGAPMNRLVFDQEQSHAASKDLKYFK